MQTDFEKHSFHADAKRLEKITMDPGMESKLTSFLKKMTRGKSMAAPMVLMGTAGGAYYLYKQRGADRAENGLTNHPSEDLTKSKMPGAPQEPTGNDQKEMTKPPEISEVSNDLKDRIQSRENLEKEVQGFFQFIK